MSNIGITDRAQREVTRVFRWYAQRSPAAARNFLLRLETTYRRIEDDPRCHPEFLRNFRFQKVVKYPYVVVFRMDGYEPIVVAVNHTSRSLKFWKRRLR